MKNYRVSIRDDKAEFFEELMKHLDFIDFQLDDTFNYSPAHRDLMSSDKEKHTSREFASEKRELQIDRDPGYNNLREVMHIIEEKRNKSRKKK